jgi:hypothetical protein
LLIVAVIVYVVATHGHDIVETSRRLKPSELIAITALALVTLICRTEALVVCLDAMPSVRPRRVDLHSANSLTFLAGTINHYLQAVVRGALVKRVDPARAPTIPQMVVVDTATGLIEAIVVAVLIVVSTATLHLAWWVPALIVLRAVGLHPSLLQAVATFVAGGVLSTLFAGPGAGTAGGPLLVFGHRHLALAATAGLALSITLLIAGILYVLPGGPTFLVRLRRPVT